MSNVFYLLPYSVPLAIIIGTMEGVIWPFRLIQWIFSAVVILDTIVPGAARDNPSLAARAPTGFFWRLAIRMWLPAQAAIVACGLAAATAPALRWVDFAAITVSAGMAGGMLNVPVAHELMHGRGRGERAIAEILMSLMSYPHFCIEHVRGHHARVGTTADPATARAGESLYAFLPRTVAGGFLSAWRSERERMRSLSRPILSLRNRAWRGTVEVVLIHAVIGYFWGAPGVLFFAGQSAVAILMLETINYVQHYGLTRRATPGGGHEPVGMMHSWNSAHPVSNWFLLNLGRHSDHHCDAGKEYRSLRNCEQAPRLPTGLFGMFVLALFPPLWHAIMDPLAQSFAGGGTP